MHKLKFLILFIFFIQVIPKILDLYEKILDGSFTNKCENENGKFLDIKTADQCLARNSILKDDNGSKCCSFNGKVDPLIPLKKIYGENWKKIISQKQGYDLNISEEEIRKLLSQFTTVKDSCVYMPKGANTTMIYTFSLATLDGIANYDCGEGKKIFNRKEYHPTSKEEILDTQLIESFILAYTEKDCLKRGTKLSDENYQICWCENVRLSFGAMNEKTCIPFRTSTFQERLKKQMEKVKKTNGREEFKCTCSNNKGKTIKGRYNSVTGEVKVE